MVLLILLASAALVLSSVANIRNRQQDKETLTARVIQSCEQFNRTRKTTYESNRALAAISIANGRTPGYISPVIIAFLEFNEDANEPVSCDLSDPNFMIDPTQPSIPPIPEVFNVSPS